ncbi:MAG TPA: hypothetical protein VJA66_01130 [Thermoanaerobaculia bacterium]
MSADRPLSRKASILVGIICAGAGIAIVLVSIFADSKGFRAPRWVVASAGGAFLFFGGWTAALYAMGYDPRRSEETLPSPAVQLAVLIPGLALFAAPFHWVAFGPGPRQFSTSWSLPPFTVGGSSGSTTGRIAFGVGALVVDALLVASVVRLVRQMLRGRAIRASSPRAADPPV